MRKGNEPKGAVVLTTHERSGYFTSVLGENIDIRFDSRHGPVLEDVLHNVLVAGGRLVILDEAFFVDVDDLARGLELFYKHERNSDKLNVIVVCTHRKSGDFFLAFLVLYCHIYNIIYDKFGVDVSIELIRLLEQDNSFSDVAHLAERGSWQMAKDAERRSKLHPEGMECEMPPPLSKSFGFEKRYEKLCVDVGGGRFININMDISGCIKQ